jgi:DNA modification methylase
MGSGTIALVASALERQFIGFEQNPEYLKIAETRMAEKLGLFNTFNNEPL